MKTQTGGKKALIVHPKVNKRGVAPHVSGPLRTLVVRAFQRGAARPRACPASVAPGRLLTASAAHNAGLYGRQRERGDIMIP